jgi:hypothetical protein
VKTFPRAISILGLAGILSVTGAGLAYGIDNGNNAADKPVVSSPGTQKPGMEARYDVLQRIRIELAQKLGIDPLEVKLTSLQSAGWDGCLGVIEPNQPCTMQFIAGLIAFFEADGESYRYHIGGDRYVGPVDPEKADDGAPVDPGMAADRYAFLAEYARQELALRLGVTVADLDIAFVIPTEFGDGCLGFAPDNARCAQLLRPEPGALVGIRHGGEVQLYSVTFNQVVWHDQDSGQTTVEVDEKLAAIQEQLRIDLAERLGIDIDEVGIVSFRNVTWPDGCLGVIDPAALCLAALTPGYLAFLSGPDGMVYRYHGGNDTFIAVDFEDRITGISDPIFEQDASAGIVNDLAGRLGVDPSEIKVQDFRQVTWSDGCLGVVRADTTCIAALTEGFLAFLEGPDGELYRYHGGAGAFIAVDFEEGILAVHDPVE